MESLRKATKERLLVDMLGNVKDGTGGGWKVLILDPYTTRIMSSAMRMSDILETGISTVEDLTKERESIPSPGVYFVQPTLKNVERICADYDTFPRYPSAHIYFSSKAPPDVIEKIKSSPKLVAKLKSFKEVNVEYVTVDSRTCVTEQPDLPVKLYGDRCEALKEEGEKELDLLAARLVTVFTALNECPAVRYVAAQPPTDLDPPGQELRSTVTARLGTKVLELLAPMARLNLVPPRDTCELLILDRGYDLLAPVIHEWSYECMVYDLLNMDGRVFRWKAETQGGKVEEHEALLDEQDDVWVDLRHEFIAKVYQELPARFKEVQMKNKSSKSAKAGEMKANAVQEMLRLKVATAKLSAHIAVSTELKNTTDKRGLTDVGEVEQDLIVGDSSQKDLIRFLAENHARIEKRDRMRMLAVYLGIMEEKLDSARRSQLQKLARITPDDMAAICNLWYLGLPLYTTAQINVPVKGGHAKRKRKGIRLMSKRENDGGFTLMRVEPVLVGLLAELVNNRLKEDDFPYQRPPDGLDDGTGGGATSARTAKSGLQWSRRAPNLGENSEEPLRRLVVCVVGPITRNESRVVFESSKLYQRDIILVGTTMETNAGFLDVLAKVASPDAEYPMGFAKK